MSIGHVSYEQCFGTDHERDSMLPRIIGAFPDGYSAMMLVGARLRHISTTKWGTFQSLNLANFIKRCKLTEEQQFVRNKCAQKIRTLPFYEPPHVDVNRPKDYNGNLPKKKYPME